MAKSNFPSNVSRRDFNKAVEAVEEGTKLKINRVSERNGYLHCPLCGSKVKYLAGSTTISIHNSSMDKNSQCEISTIEVEVRNFSSPKNSSNTLSRSKKSNFTKKRSKVNGYQPRRPIRDFDDIDELNGIKRRSHWKEEFGYIAHDSWGQDYLGQENGKNSVRARSGGHVEGNRQRF